MLLDRSTIGGPPNKKAPEATTAANNPKAKKAEQLISQKTMRMMERFRVAVRADFSIRKQGPYLIRLRLSQV
jgi:hypothetical protein